MNVLQFTAIFNHYRQVMPFMAPNFDNKEVVKFWFEVLSNESPAKLKKALESLIINNDRFPTIKQILDEINERTFTRHEDIAISGKIISAITKFGWNNQTKAQAFIGPLGWHVVESMGGWIHLCEVIDNKNLSVYQAQIRDIARNVIDKNNSGYLQLTQNNESEVKQIEESPLKKALKIIDG